MTQKRLEVIDRDELPMARDQEETVQARVLRLDHERKIAVAQEQVDAVQRDVKRLVGADQTLISLQNRERMLPRLQSLAEARARLEKAEHAVPLAQADFNVASQKASEMHERLDVIELQMDEAIQCRSQADERVALLKTEIARLEGQIASHSRLTGQENECPVCAQVLNETTFHHVQEKLKDECTDLEQKRTELDTQTQPELERADNLIMQLKNAQIEQSKKSKAADAGEGKARNRLTEATTQLEAASTNLTRTQAVLLEETPSLAEHIPEIDYTWVANEQTVITAALPVAQAAAQEL